LSNFIVLLVQGCNDVGCGQDSRETTIYSAEDVPQVAPNQVLDRFICLCETWTKKKYLNPGGSSRLQLYSSERDVDSDGFVTQADAWKVDWIPRQVLAPSR
jgi:hypothetical protein